MNNTFAELCEQLHPDNDVRGKQFEHIVKWYLQNDPYYSHELRSVERWKDSPHRWQKNECGIDLDGRLTIKAERTEKKESKGRSEFSYGSFVRSVTLPAGANEEDIKASYDKGILTVSVAVPEQAAPAEKHIAVQATS